MKRALFTLFWLAVLVFPSMARADELPWLYRGIRPLGMGDAFLTLADDSNALFYNPAGLAQIDKWNVQILNPLVEVSKSSIKLVQDIGDLKGDDPGSVADFLNDHMGEHQHFRLSLFPNFTMHNFGFGILGQGRLDAEVRNPAFPEAKLFGGSDVGGVAGVAYSFFSNNLKVGLGGKYIQRNAIDRTYGPSDIASPDFDPLKNDKISKSDFAFDLGTILDLPVPTLRPAVGAVIANIGDLDLPSGSSCPASETITANGQTFCGMPMQINVGAGIHPTFGIARTALELQINDVTKKTGNDDDMGKRIHIGAELKIPVISVRVGVNQFGKDPAKYFTAGVGIDFLLLKLDVATYAEEVGAFAGQREDRRYVAQLALGF